MLSKMIKNVAMRITCSQEANLFIYTTYIGANINGSGGKKIVARNGAQIDIQLLLRQ